MGKFISMYICFLGAVVSIGFPPFIAGMVSQSLSTGHMDTALIAAGCLVLVWPLVLASTVNCVRSTYQMYFKENRH